MFVVLALSPLYIHPVGSGGDRLGCVTPPQHSSVLRSRWLCEKWGGRTAVRPYERGRMLAYGAFHPRLCVMGSESRARDPSGNGDAALRLAQRAGGIDAEEGVSAACG